MERRELRLINRKIKIFTGKEGLNKAGFTHLENNINNFLSNHDVVDIKANCSSSVILIIIIYNEMEKVDGNER